MVKKGETIPIIYLYIHAVISGNFFNFCNPKKKKGERLLKVCSKKQFINFLHEWRIPEKIRICAEKEMEDYGLLKRIDRNIIEIRESKVKIDNVNDAYKYVGLIE
jgi:hypothetical protein